MVSCGVHWHLLVLGWPGGPGCIGLTLLVMVRQWLWLEVVVYDGSHERLP